MVPPDLKTAHDISSFFDLVHLETGVGSCPVREDDLVSSRFVHLKKRSRGEAISHVLPQFIISTSNPLKPRKKWNLVELPAFWGADRWKERNKGTTNDPLSALASWPLHFLQFPNKKHSLRRNTQHLPTRGIIHTRWFRFFSDTTHILVFFLASSLGAFSAENHKHPRHPTLGTDVTLCFLYACFLQNRVHLKVTDIRC